MTKSVSPYLKSIIAIKFTLKITKKKPFSFACSTGKKPVPTGRLGSSFEVKWEGAGHLQSCTTNGRVHVDTD